MIYSSNLLANGIQLKEIQEWLGHASFGMTADVYSHLDFSSKVKVANALFETYSQTKKEIEPIREEELERVAKKIQALGLKQSWNICHILNGKSEIEM